MFMMTNGKGFYMRFDNEWGISVQWGIANYCSNKDTSLFSIEKDRKAGEDGCNNAEIAIINPDGELIHVEEWSDSVCGYVSADEVLKWMNYAANAEHLMEKTGEIT